MQNTFNFNRFTLSIIKLILSFSFSGLYNMYTVEKAIPNISQSAYNCVYSHNS